MGQAHPSMAVYCTWCFRSGSPPAQIISGKNFSFCLTLEVLMFRSFSAIVHTPLIFVADRGRILGLQPLQQPHHRFSEDPSLEHVHGPARRGTG